MPRGLKPEQHLPSLSLLASPSSSSFFRFQPPICHEGLGIISRRPRALLFSHHSDDPTPGFPPIVGAKHSVFERLDDGRELHEVGVYSLSPDAGVSSLGEYFPVPRISLDNRLNINPAVILSHHPVSLSTLSHTFTGIPYRHHPALAAPTKTLKKLQARTFPPSHIMIINFFCTISPIRRSPPPGLTVCVFVVV